MASHSSTHACRRPLCRFVFLRFFSAALLSPYMRPFNLVEDVPQDGAKVMIFRRENARL